MSIKLPTGHISMAKHSRTVKFSPILILYDVLYVPDFNYNLLSVSKLNSSLNNIVNFNGFQCLIQDKKTMRMIGSGDKREDLYYLNFDSKLACSASKTIHSNIPLPDSALWHFRLGHLSFSRMNFLKSCFPFVHVDCKATCDVCHFAKHKKLPFPDSCNKASKPFDLIHFDIWGPISVPSVHKHVYFLTVVDDYSRYTWLTLMKTKSETRQHVIDFITLIENHFNYNVKTVKSDNGPEFNIPQFYASKGILHQTSCVETPQQNARVERKHQHILNITRALLFQSHLPKSFWSYVAVHAVFIMNRVPSPLLQNQSPYFLLHKMQPDLHQLKVFGSLAYASTLQAHISKLASRARKCIFLGYKSGMKGVVLLDIHSMQIFVSRNVTHHESILPYQSHSSAIPWNYHTNIQSVSDISPAPKTEIVYDVSPLSLDSPPFNPDNISSPPPLPQPFYLNLLDSGLNQLI